MKVYLAGGMRTKWRDTFIDALKDSCEFLNPMDLSGSLADIAGQEEQWLQECDLVLAYAEDSNPRPIGLAYELGYARALGKHTILLVDEIDPRTHWLQYMVDFCTIKNTTAMDRIERLAVVEAAHA